MKAYTEYNVSDGHIIGSGIISQEAFVFLSQMSNVIDGQYLDTEFYVKDGCAIAYPPKQYEFSVWNFQDESWVVTPESLKNAMESRSRELDLLCKKDILSGFVSNALGVAHLYPSKETDQANLNASVTASMYPWLSQDWTTPFWCERDGQWQYRMHTAAQIQQVGFDGKNAVLSFLAKNASLQEQLANSQTIEDIMAVQW